VAAAGSRLLTPKPVPLWAEGPITSNTGGMPRAASTIGGVLSCHVPQPAPADGGRRDNASGPASALA